MLAYFMTSDYVRHARKALANFRMGKCSITDYIDDFMHLLVCCTDVQESEAKFLFENNIADWLACTYCYKTAQTCVRPCSVLNKLEVCNKFTSSTIRHLQCSSSSSSNHAAAPAQAPSQWLGKFTVKCFRCGKTGHKRADCCVNLNKLKKNGGS